jgi:CheY-like chemotaxis protein
MGQLLAPAVSKKAKFSYRLGRELPKIQGDPSQLRQVVMNLIMNASDALSERVGRIQVKTSAVTLDDKQLRSRFLGEQFIAGRFVAFEVIDEGCGMDDATTRQIFDPFFTTKTGGRGLGLAATLGIVRAHSGLVSVDSEPDEGTRFTVLFPALPMGGDPGNDSDSDTGYGHEESLCSTACPEGSVLIVDDEASVRRLANAALTRSGFRVVEAADGEEALARLDHEENIGVVVVDLTMPGLSGMELLSAIRKRSAELPVLLSSGYPDDFAPDGTFEKGVTAFLAKPYGAGQLNRGIADLLRRARERTGGRRRSAKVRRVSSQY